MVQGSTNDTSMRKIYKNPPHITVDNYFVSDAVMDYAGGLGFGILGTCCRDRLPKGVLRDYFHYDKHIPKCKRARIAKFFNPIIAIKEVEAKNGRQAFQRMHVSMQSTSSANFSSVNSLNNVSVFVGVKNRGKGCQKRSWPIEMNEARLAYLKQYGKMDQTNARVKTLDMGIKTVKYWHSALDYGFSLATIQAYDLYVDACMGKLCEEWKIESNEIFPLTSFVTVMSEQMLKYDPLNQIYLGDDQRRDVTRSNKKYRKERKRKHLTMSVGRFNGYVTREQFIKAMTQPGSRLCNNITSLNEHYRSIVKSQNGKVCQVCGQLSWTFCGKCGKSVHFFPRK